MAKIANTYDLVINITNAEYTFTGTDRDAQFTPSAPELVTAANCTQIFAPSAQACAVADYDFTIERARILSSGAPGVQPPTLKRASQVLLELCKQDGTFITSIVLKFQNWNEWTEINGILRPYENQIVTWDPAEVAINKPVYFSPKVQNTYFNVDDYNIASPYVGEKFSPVLEMIVRTSGMTETYANNIF